MKTLRKLRSNPLAITGILLLLFFLVVAALAPRIAPPSYDPYRIPRAGYSSVPKPPSAEHPFGTTQGQYDILYGVVWGTRTAFRVALMTTLSITLIGSFLGVIAGFYGGVVDNIIMRIVDVALSLPRLIGAIVVASILGKGLYEAVIALIAFGWMPYVRVVRGEVLSVKASQYVEAARALGASDLRIVVRHILPNIVYPVLVLTSMDMGSMVLWVSTLSFLGLGPEIGYADWGQLVSFSRDWLIGVPGDAFQYWYTAFFPALSITLFVLSWGLIGDALRDALDPKL